MRRGLAGNRRGSNPRRPTPMEQGMPALTSQLLQSFMYISRGRPWPWPALTPGRCRGTGSRQRRRRRRRAPSPSPGQRRQWRIRAPLTASSPGRQHLRRPGPVQSLGQRWLIRDTVGGGCGGQPPASAVAAPGRRCVDMEGSSFGYPWICNSLYVVKSYQTKYLIEFQHGRINRCVFEI